MNVQKYFWSISLEEFYRYVIYIYIKIETH